jgi:hypothetical protein
MLEVYGLRQGPVGGLTLGMVSHPNLVNSLEISLQFKRPNNYNGSQLERYVILMLRLMVA